MRNREIAKIFYEIAQYLAMEGVAFKPQAYERAALGLESLAEDVGEIYRRGGEEAVCKIPGVGRGLAEKIIEYLKTGKVKEHQALKKRTPVELGELTAVEGMGPKTVKIFYERLKIKNLKDLKEAAQAGKIRGLPGFGPKKEQNILEGVEFLERSRGRLLLSDVLPAVYEIVGALKNLKEVKIISEAGSVRRRKETVGDIDILVAASDSRKVVDYLVSLPGTVKVWSRGSTKASVRLKAGFDVDLRVLPPSQFGSALQYFTGSKEHNIALRRIAIERGLKLSEYGLFSGKKLIAGRTEEEIYRALGMDFIEPEMRENQGEIELAKKGELPELVGYGDLRGDLQVQTDWSDGADSIEECAAEAMKFGLEYIAVTDHTKRLAVAGGLNENEVLKQTEEIDKINSRLESRGSNFRVLKGSECDILRDGSLDLSDEVLTRLDVVGAAVHSHFNLSEEEQTERIVRAMENKNVDIIFHPTGRVIRRREPYEINIDRIIETAKRTGTVLEIDAYPDRLDLKDEYIRKCVLKGVKLAVDSDAHSTSHFQFLEYGLAQARRGWAGKKDIINTRPFKEMLKMLK